MTLEDSPENYETYSDMELVEAFKEGREWAFNEVVRRYSSKVLTLCSYFLRDQDQAQDVAQDVFLKMYRALARFRGASKLSTWVHTISVNTCKNRLSFWKRFYSFRKRYEEDPLTKKRDDGPEQEVFRNERACLVREAIASLPAIHREILILKDIQGCSYEEIREVLGVSAGTVKSRLHRARDALGDRLRGVLGPDAI